jgi:hypothetical protein
VIPWLAMVRVRGGNHRRAVRLWLPLFLLWPLMLPFAVVLAVAGPVVARAYGMATAGLLRTAWQFAGGWRGTHIEVESPEFVFQVRFI